VNAVPIVRANIRVGYVHILMFVYLERRFCTLKWFLHKYFERFKSKNLNETQPQNVSIC
jgi:hypothetical protein